MEANLGLKDEFINQLEMLRKMAKDYALKIEELAKTNPMGVIELQDELQDVTTLIATTEEELRNIRINILKNTRTLLEKDRSNPRYQEMDEQLKSVGYGGKTRKNRKNKRKSRR